MKKIFNILFNILTTLFISLVVFISIYSLYSIVMKKYNKTPIISFYTIISPSMEPTINIYDVAIVKRVNDKSALKVNDIINFHSDDLDTNYLIVHRINKIEKLDGRRIYYTKGDNNISIDDGYIEDDDIKGLVIGYIPYIGKLEFFITSIYGWIFIIFIPSVLIILYNIKRLVKNYKRKA